MKWVTLISFILLLSSARSWNLQRVARSSEHKSEIVHRYNDLKEETFKAVTMITFAQYLQKCSYEGLSKLVKDVVELAQKCAAKEDDPDCGKSLPAIFLDEICQLQSLPDSYGDMADCCKKGDPERNACFLSYKVQQPDFVQPYQRPAADVICKQYQDDRVSLLGHFIYAVARRNPYLYAPTIFSLAADYEHALQTCCQESDVGACLDTKAVAIKEKAKKVSMKHEYACGIIKKFGDRTFQAIKLAHLSQKYPKAPFSELVKVVQDLKDVYKECCDGDMLECMDDRAQLIEYVCSKQDVFSSKIKHCCEKPVLERSQCIVEADHDDKPEGLPSLVEKYIHDKEVCKSFEAGHDEFLSQFLYEYSRRHPEFSVQLILRVTKGYEELLEKCCKTDNPAECYSKAEEDLNKHIKETQDVVNTNCELLNTQGEGEFLQTLLIRYTKKMPRVSTDTLLDIGKRMTAIGTKCCQMPEEKRMPCSEGYLNIVIQDMCRKQETSPINENVSRCCSDSYAYRRPCFTAMGVDTKYEPPKFDPEMFNFDEKLCSAPDAEKELGQLKLLINLIKRKPQMTKDQIETISGDFTNMVKKCCQQPNIETCFGEEGANLIAKSRTTLEIGA